MAWSSALLEVFVGIEGRQVVWAQVAGADLALSKSTALYANVNYEVVSNGNQFGYNGGLRVRF